MTRVGASVDRLVATPLGSGVLITGRHPGPAGIATVGLLGGSAELAVDVLEHDALVWLRLDDPTSPDALRLARHLLGPLATSRLAGSLGAEGLVWDRATDQDDLGRWGDGDGLGLGPLGRLALALGELARPHLPDRAVAVGLVEAGALALGLGPELAPTPTAVELIRAGIGRWEALGAHAFDDVDPAVLRQALDLDDGWGAALDVVDPALARSLTPLVQALAHHLEGPPVAAAGGARLRLHPPEPAPRPILLDLAALPAAAPRAPVAQRDRAATETTERADGPAVPVAFSADLDARLIGVEHDGHHLRVHVGGLDDDDPEPWLRVFAAGSRPTPLALAPFAESRRPWRTATALLPPGTAADQLLVDVTTSPAEPWASATARALARATHLGALAARAGRRAEPDAQDRWYEAAEAWDHLDDDVRADDARTFAHLRDPIGLGPLLLDGLA